MRKSDFHLAAFTVLRKVSASCAIVWPPVSPAWQKNQLLTFAASGRWCSHWP